MAMAACGSRWGRPNRPFTASAAEVLTRSLTARRSRKELSKPRLPQHRSGSVCVLVITGHTEAGLRTELAWGTSEMYHKQSYVTTAQVVAQGKAVLDGGATRTIGSIEALQENLANINVEKRGHTGIEKVDLSEKTVFGFGNSSKNQRASTASVSVPMGGKLGMMKVHALDQGSAPILLSVHSLRQLGALVDFENDLAVFRHVDPTRVIQLERSSAGHQIMPLTEDVYQSAKQLSRAVPSFKDLE